MAKVAGRDAVIYKNAVAISGVRVMNIKIDNSAIDVTDKDSAGIAEVLAKAATRQITLTVEGVYKDPVLRDIAFDASTSPLLTDITFKFADALAAKDTIGGNFFMTSYEEGNPYEDAATFSCSFTSSGAWTFS